MPPHPYRTAVPDEPDAELPATSGWGEDLFLVGLFASVGALGMGIGVAADSAVEVSIGMLLVIFAAKVLFGIVRHARRSERVADVRPAPRQ